VKVKATDVINIKFLSTSGKASDYAFLVWTYVLYLSFDNAASTSATYLFDKINTIVSDDSTATLGAFMTKYSEFGKVMNIGDFYLTASPTYVQKVYCDGVTTEEFRGL
jgi:hypothetical protein